MDGSNEYPIGRDGVKVDVTIDEAINDAGLSEYSFQLTGAANKAGDWSSLTETAPEVILTWSISSGEKTLFSESAVLIEQENSDIEQEKNNIADQGENVSENINLDKGDTPDKENEIKRADFMPEEKVSDDNEEEGHKE